MKKEDICFMSACDMAEKIRTQELTSLEITEAIIERIEKINPIINAYCTTTFDLAREMAKAADEKVSKGETVIICKRNVPIAEIKPIVALPHKKRPVGLAGKEYPDFEISDDFFEPLPNDIVAAFKCRRPILSSLP